MVVEKRHPSSQALLQVPGKAQPGFCIHHSHPRPCFFTALAGHELAVTGRLPIERETLFAPYGPWPALERHGLFKELMQLRRQKLRWTHCPAELKTTVAALLPPPGNCPELRAMYRASQGRPAFSFEFGEKNEMTKIKKMI